MRIFKELFVKHTTHEQSMFYIFYSNNSYLAGRMYKRADTDGTLLNDLIVDKETLEEGVYRRNLDGYEIEFGEKWLKWQKIENNLFQYNEEKVLRIADFTLAQNFVNHNQKKIMRIEPQNHPYHRMELKSSGDEIFFVNWSLGNTCNFSCSYCPSYLHDGSNSWVHIKDAVKFVDTFMNSSRKKQIVFEFTGGEVSLYPWFSQLCTYIKSKGAFVSMLSNGSSSFEWWKKVIPYLDTVKLSYHPEFTDKECFLNLLFLLKGKVELDCKVMVAPGNIKLCSEIANAIKMSHDGVTSLMPLNENFDGELLPEYTYEELQAINKFNASSIREGGKSLGSPLERKLLKVYEGSTPTEIKDVDLITNKENCWFGWKCASGLNQIVINGDDIYRGWCYVGGKIGSISNPGFKLPKRAMQCTKELCHHSFDFYAPKEKEN